MRQRFQVYQPVLVLIFRMVGLLLLGLAAFVLMAPMSAVAQQSGASQPLSLVPPLLASSDDPTPTATFSATPTPPTTTPSPTLTPTPSPTATPRPTPTNTVGPIPTPTTTPSSTATATKTPDLAGTSTPQGIATPRYTPISGSPTDPISSGALSSGQNQGTNLLNLFPSGGLFILVGGLFVMVMLVLLFLQRRRRWVAAPGSHSSEVLATPPSSPPMISAARPLGAVLGPPSAPQQTPRKTLQESRPSELDEALFPTQPAPSAAPSSMSLQAIIPLAHQTRSSESEEAVSAQEDPRRTSPEEFLAAISAAGEPLSPEQQVRASADEQEQAEARAAPVPIGLFSGRTLAATYRIRGQLGQGTCGVVYVAEQMDGHLKAVKLIHPRFLNRPRARRRFLEEAQNWTLLEHPALVRVEAVGLDWNRGYLALPYLNGGTLRERLHGPLSLELIWHFLEPLASALDYLHECQVLHLNVTPQNVLFDEWDQPLLADAGLAPLLNQLAQEGGARLALPLSPYLAPEQLAGQSDQRSDMYALGMLLYQMVVGQPPAADASTGALIQQVIQETPLLQGHSPLWQTDFAQMVVRSLSRKPEDRYQTASELLEAFYTLAEQMD